MLHNHMTCMPTIFPSWKSTDSARVRTSNLGRTRRAPYLSATEPADKYYKYFFKFNPSLRIEYFPFKAPPNVLQLCSPCSMISTRFLRWGSMAHPMRMAICCTILIPVWRACQDFLDLHTAFRKGSSAGMPGRELNMHSLARDGNLCSGMRNI